jgi:hypothetical protein
MGLFFPLNYLIAQWPGTDNPSDDCCGDYLDLIPPPNSIQPNFTEWVCKNICPLVDIQDAAQAMYQAFTLENAVGVQMDILGAILGVSRTVTFEPGGGVSPVLSDAYYRIVLTAKIILNHWDGTKDQIYDFWAAFFPQYPVLILDNQDMTMSVLVVGMPNNLDGSAEYAYDSDTDSLKGYDLGYWEPLSSLLRGLVTHGYFVPKPAGVRVEYSFMDDPAFSYDLNTDLMKGYDDGTWVSFS